MSRHSFSQKRNCKTILAFSVALALAITAEAVQAKSLYAIANINASPTPIYTYDIQSAPNHLVLQSQTTVPALAGGAVGLGIDTASAKLFITYEGSNTIRLVSATNFDNLGTTTAPSASNLAGIVVDQGKNKVYTVDRETNHLYVYSWNSATNTLTLDGGAYKVLTGVLRANGIALDETRGRLYIGDRDTTTVRYYDTNNFVASPIAVAGTVDLSAQNQTVMGIAVDSTRNLLYTGNAYSPYGSKGKLVKYDLNTNTISAYTLPGAASGDNIVGVAVDENTGQVYTSTGNQGSGGTDTLIVFDSNLTVLKNDTGDIGNPTGIAIPRLDVSFNPLNFSKVDAPDPVATGSQLTYTLCYDNLVNPVPVSNATMVDTLPAGVTFVSATGPYSVSGNQVTWTEGTVPGNGSQVCRNLVVNVTATAGSNLLNNATIDSDQTPPTTRTALTSVVSGSTTCDINNNGIVDRNDIAAIFAARGTQAQPGDPRDADRDGLITVNDARQCTLQCTNYKCAP